MTKFGAGVLKYKLALETACNTAMVDLGEQEVEVYRGILEQKELVATKGLYNSVGFSTKYESSANESEYNNIQKPTKEFEVNIGTSAPYARDVNDGYAGGHVTFNQALIDSIKDWGMIKGIPLGEDGARAVAKNLADNGHVAQPFHNNAFHAISVHVQTGAFSNAFNKALKVALSGTQNTDKVG
jgi:hypothetical protein